MPLLQADYVDESERSLDESERTFMVSNISSCPTRRVYPLGIVSPRSSRRDFSWQKQVLQCAKCAYSCWNISQRFRFYCISAAI